MKKKKFILLKSSQVYSHNSKAIIRIKLTTVKNYNGSTIIVVVN